MAELLSIGDAIEDGLYEVHSRFRRAENLTDGDRLVSIVTPEIGAGPRNIVVADLVPSDVQRVRVRRSEIELDTQWFSIDAASTYDSSLRIEIRSPESFRSNLGLFCDLLVDLSPEKSLAFLLDERRLDEFRPGFEQTLADHIAHCVRDTFTSDLLRGVSRLKGAGFGLTPSGDDFICGLLIGTHILDRICGTQLALIRRAVFESARSGSILTDTSLALARDGLVFERLRDLVAALTSGEGQDVRRSALTLFAVGHTSGADLATGLFMTVDHGVRVNGIAASPDPPRRKAPWS